MAGMTGSSSRDFKSPSEASKQMRRESSRRSPWRYPFPPFSVLFACLAAALAATLAATAERGTVRYVKASRPDDTGDGLLRRWRCCGSAPVVVSCDER